ncbi:MAG: acyltransferase family protein [Clostridiales bacterium]|nr:acyltransferase family protein [Clostridiales bacterium]
MSEKKSRNYKLCHVRAISCIAVVVLHTFFACFGFSSAAGGTAGAAYKFTVIVRNLMYWAVPCFIMVSGALLLDPSREVGYKKVFRKYIPRMVAALVLFSVIFLGVDLGFGFASWSGDTIPEFLKSLLSGQGVWSHMWYLYTMIALYLLLPVLHAFVKSSERKTWGILILLLFLFLSVLPLLEKLLPISFGFYIPVYTIYPLYFLLGWWIVSAHREETAASTSAEQPAETGKRGLGLGCVFVAVFLVGMILCTLVYLGSDQAVLKDAVNDYSFPLTVLGALGMFMLITSINGQSRVLEFIDQHSFGIYLIHMIPLKILALKNLFNPYDIGVWFVFVVALGVFLISLAVTFVLRKIPFVKKML